MKKSLEIFKFIKSLAETAERTCKIAITCVAFTSSPCTLPAVAVNIFIALGLFAVKFGIELSERFYAEIVNEQNSDFEKSRQEAQYKNIFTVNANIIQTFRSSQRVGVLLGEIAEGVASDDERRRRLSSDCVSTRGGFIFGCSKPSCEEPTRICDGSFNYPLIAILEGGELSKRMK